MIYQLYPNKKLKNRPYSKYYSTICLDCLNEQYLPQLKMEYSGMIYLWKNKLDDDNWIGFTSYRQKTKSPFVLDNSNYTETINLLKKYDILCFLNLIFDISLYEHTNKKHARMNSWMEYLFKKYFDEELPKAYKQINCGCYANYWIINKENFHEFMQWSYPKVLKIVELSNSINYFAINNHYSHSGYLIERLFIIWYMKYQKTIFSLFDKIKPSTDI